jgi:hypothetical protein
MGESPIAALPQRAGGLRAPERPAVPDYIPTPSIGTGGDKRRPPLQHKSAIMLTYIQALERGRLGMPYEAAKVSLLRILGNGLFPERSAPPVRELQPHLYSAAHEQAPWAQGARRASPARKGALTRGGGLA